MYTRGVQQELKSPEVFRSFGANGPLHRFSKLLISLVPKEMTFHVAASAETINGEVCDNSDGFDATVRGGFLSQRSSLL